MLRIHQFPRRLHAHLAKAARTTDFRRTHRDRQATGAGLVGQAIPHARQILALLQGHVVQRPAKPMQAAPNHPRLRTPKVAVAVAAVAVAVAVAAVVAVVATGDIR